MGGRKCIDMYVWRIEGKCLCGSWLYLWGESCRFLDYGGLGEVGCEEKRREERF